MPWLYVSLAAVSFDFTGVLVTTRPASCAVAVVVRVPAISSLGRISSRRPACSSTCERSRTGLIVGSAFSPNALFQISFVLPKPLENASTVSWAMVDAAVIPCSVFSVIPFARPCIRKSPISYITLEGEWMPNAALTFETTVLPMLVTALAMEESFSVIAFLRPLTS